MDLEWSSDEEEEEEEEKTTTTKKRKKKKKKEQQQQQHTKTGEDDEEEHDAAALGPRPAKRSRRRLSPRSDEDSTSSNCDANSVSHHQQHPHCCFVLYSLGPFPQCILLCPLPAP